MLMLKIIAGYEVAWNNETCFSFFVDITFYARTNTCIERGYNYEI